MKGMLLADRRLQQNGGGMWGASRDYWYSKMLLQAQMVAGEEPHRGWRNPVSVNSNNQVQLNGKAALQAAVVVCGGRVGEGRGQDVRARLEHAAKEFKGVSDADAAQLLGVVQVVTYTQVRLQYMPPSASFAVASADAVSEIRAVRQGGDRFECGRQGGCVVIHAKGSSEVVCILLLTHIFTVSYGDQARVYAFISGVPLLSTKPQKCATSDAGLVYYCRLPCPPEAQHTVIALTDSLTFEGASVSRYFGVPSNPNAPQEVVEEPGVIVVAPRSTLPEPLQPEDLERELLKGQDALVERAKAKAEVVMAEQQRVQNLDMAEMEPKKRRTKMVRRRDRGCCRSG